MNPGQGQAFMDAMAAASRCYRAGDYENAFGHLELAHVLGQRYVVPHVRTHWWMAKIGVKRRAPAQVWGQLVRIILGALGSAMNLVPTGNTGGTNVSMFQRLPVDPSIRHLMEE